MFHYIASHPSVAREHGLMDRRGEARQGKAVLTDVVLCLQAQGIIMGGHQPMFAFRRSPQTD